MAREFDAFDGPGNETDGVKHGIGRRRADPVEMSLETRLLSAAMFGDATAVARLLSAGARASHEDSMGRTPLHYACRHYRPDAALILIDSGVDLDAGDRHRRRAIHFSAEQGHRGILLALIKAGASVGLRDHSGNAALHYACNSGRIDSAVALVMAGADAGAMNCDGKIPADLGKPAMKAAIAAAVARSS